MAKKKRICSIDGCSNPHRARGWCTSHYERWFAHGDPLSGGTGWGAAKAFLESAQHEDTDKCVIWPFSRDLHGYGKIKLDGKHRLVHRVICERAHGPAPTPEHQAAHLCGKGHEGCINRKHLAWKTHAENQADRIAHGTSNQGERQGRSKLTVSDVKEIRRNPDRQTAAALAAKYGVGQTTVRAVQSGRSWKSV